MSEEMNSTPSFGNRMGLALKKILRFVLILAIIVGIVAAAYFSIPYLYEKFILPVETNTDRLGEISSKQAAEVSGLANQVSDLQSRLNDLENRQTENAQTLADMQGQVQNLESEIISFSKNIKLLESMQLALDELAATSINHEALLVGDNSSLANLQRQVTMSRAIELLSRARQYLSLSNYGLAKQDVLVARDLLSNLQTEMPEEKTESLQEVIQHLDLALGNLPAFPVVAVDYVDIAWLYLVNGLPDLPADALTPDVSLAPAETP